MGFLKTASYALLVTILLMGTAEVGFRLNGNYKTYAEKTSGSYESDRGKESSNALHIWDEGVFILDKGEYNYEYSVNKLGFREREVMLEDSLSNAVFVFGDSFIEGAGAPYDSTFPRFLENILIEAHPAMSVYNFGVSGSDPFFNHAVYEQLAILNPGWIIFSVNYGDFVDYMNRGGFERFSDDGTSVKYRDPEWFENLYRHSHFARFVMIEILGYEHNLVRTKNLPRLEAEAGQKIAACLADAKRISDQYSTRFLIMTHPFPNSICNSSSNSAGNQINETYFGNLPVVHLTEGMSAVMKASDCDSYGWPVDGHFNSKGYQLLAKVFYGEVKETYPGYFGSK